MSTVRSQLKRVKTLTLQIRPPKHWVFVVEEGDDVSAEERAQVQPGDMVVIRMVPRGYLNV